MELKETYNEARRLFTKDFEDYFHEFCRYFKLQFGGKNSTLFFTSSPTHLYTSYAGYQHHILTVTSTSQECSFNIKIMIKNKRKLIITNL